MQPARFEIGRKHKQAGETSSRASWNTPRKDARGGMSYASRMAIAFALTSLMTVLILVGVVTVVWSGVFTDYTRANIQDMAGFTAQRLALSYDEDGPWTTEFIAQVAESSLEDDIGLQVMDRGGTIIYDDTWPAAGAAAEAQRSDRAQGATTEQSAGSSASGSSSRAMSSHALTSTAPTGTEASVTQEITTSDGTKVGTVRVWVIGSDVLLSRADQTFRDRTFNAMMLAALIAICVSVIVGFLVSRMLTNPIRRITSTAKQIRDGDWSARTGMKGDDEIDRLGETFDEMTTSLERDLKHEKRITSDVAHELRTPLMGMLATVEAMQDGVMEPDEEHLETVASETRRLARLVQQMLDLSRMETRTTPLHIEEVEMVPFVQRIVSGQQQLFQDHDLRLRFVDDTQGRSSTVECDPDMITQAIINIMSNAMRYTPEGGWVVVSVLADRKEVMISISDTGIGIAKDDLARIFSRFWRADASRAREAGGLGVGLSLTKHIVERHKGYIAVESELEKGTTFTIHLPREHTPEASSSTMNN